MTEPKDSEARGPIKREPTRRRPLDELDAFFRQDPFRGILKSIDDFFENHSLFSGGFPVRLYETRSEWVVEAKLPGASRENIHIDLSENRIRIAVENDASVETDQKDKGIYSQERQFEHAERLIAVPYVIDRTLTHASFLNGILKIHGPKYPKTGNTLNID